LKPLCGLAFAAQNGHANRASSLLDNSDTHHSVVSYNKKMQQAQFPAGIDFQAPSQDDAYDRMY
jgi:hypothetical protein